MARFKHFVLVCTNSRDKPDARGDCTQRRGPEILSRLKELTAEHKLKGKVRVTKSGCLDFCAKGCVVAVFSEGLPARETWYTHVTPDDADALFDSHILRGEQLTRLVEGEKHKE